MSSSASRVLLQPPMNIRTPPCCGCKVPPAIENLAEGPTPNVVTLVHLKVSASILHAIIVTSTYMTLIDVRENSVAYQDQTYISHHTGLHHQ